MKKIFTLILCFAAGSLHAQFSYSLDQTIPVLDGDKVIPYPWNGGLNAAQYNTMDLNGDGNEDLVIYDRMARKVLTFLAAEGRFIYQPEYEIFFPPEITNWLLLRDFDNDGRKDIFTGNLFGARVFRNVSSENHLQWEPYYFYAGNSKSEVLLTKGLSGKINLQMQFDDLPSVSDADGDGDIDIFCMDFSGSGRVEYHRNYSMERYGKPDSLDFELITKSWGDFAECDCAKFAFNNTDCSFSGGRTKHEGGKSLLLMDANGDGISDLFLSEAECDILSLLPNTGTIDEPVINSSTTYPATPAIFMFYPTPYFEDVDQDGIRDLMVTPNVFSKADPAVNLRESNWFYKNIGTDLSPQFMLSQKNFLQDEMIDLGDNSVPAFADLDGDGDLDLFVSSNHFPSSITVYKNTGTRGHPQFEFYTNDYLNLSATQYRNMKIQFTDINGDGAPDLVFSATLIENNLTRVFALFNKKKGSLDFSGVAAQQLDFTISGPEHVHFTDVNNDGRNDILRGRSNGALEYWRNTGDLSFTLENPQFLGIGANALRVNLISTTADLDGDGRMDLILTDHTGRLQIISNYRAAANVAGAVTDVVYNTLTDSYYAPNLGGRIWPAAGNLFSSRYSALIIGTTLGGLRFLRPDNMSSEAPRVSLYPNPKKVSEHLTIESDADLDLEVFGVRGELIQHAIRVPKGQNHFNLQLLAQGVYIFRFSNGNKTVVRRLIVH
jgi:hypothetical protein